MGRSVPELGKPKGLDGRTREHGGWRRMGVGTPQHTERGNIMKRILSGTVTALLICGASAGASTYAARAAGGVSGPYYQSLLYPQGGGISHGSMATMPGNGGIKVKFYDGYLKPGEIYREEIRTGPCGSGGTAVAQLPRSQADDDGSINIVATLKANALQGGGTLHVDVVQDSSGATPVACGQIRKAEMVLRLHSVKTNVVANATGLALISTNVPGNEVLYRTPNVRGTEVVIYAQGLEPGTLHEEHIHSGHVPPG